MPHLTIRLFGLPQFSLDGTPLKVDRRKTQALLAYLACAATEGCSRETLSALFWPDASGEQAGAYLRQALWDFSKAAGEGWVEREGAAIRLNPTADIQVDVREFEDRLARWKVQGKGNQRSTDSLPMLEEATALFQADFLAGFTLRDSPEFDDWQVLQSEGLRLKLGEALEALAGLFGSLGQYEPAINAALRWLALDELNEPAHRALMRLYHESGQRRAAQRQFEACQRKLQDELGVPPEPETIQLYQQVSARPVETPPAPSAAPRAIRPAAAPSPLPVYLPTQATSFFGREDELQQIKARLADPECRLITLVGPGGTGKTRLAIQAAGQSTGYPHPLSFPHGVYFIPLAGAAHPGEAVLAIAAALKLEMRTEYGQGLSAESALAQLLTYLSECKILLVLDNLEQLLDTAVEAESGLPTEETLPGLVTALLAAAPEMKIIATSRTRINLPEEWVFEVVGLPYPRGDQERLVASYPAVQLFLKGAQRVSGFVPREADWPAIARICQATGGMPLALELASVWVKMLSCQEIANEIERSLDFLEAERAGAPERHRSLRAVFDYSWRLLSEPERGVLRRLSIFRGGFSREAAFQVAGASLGLLSRLVDRSLLRRVSSGRFDLHEMVKQYAAEKLAASPTEQEETGGKHAHFYADFLSEKSTQLRGRDQHAALAALRLEEQNVRRGWLWLVEHRQYETIEPIEVGLILYYEMHGNLRPASELFHALIGPLRDQYGHPGETPWAALYALALAAVGRYDFDSAHRERTEAAVKESMEISRRLPDSPARGFIMILNAAGPRGFSLGDMVPYCQEIAAIFQASGDPWGSGLAYLIMGDTLLFGGGSLPEAQTAYQTGLEIFSRLENDWGRALCLNGLTYIAARTGQVDDMLRFSQEAQAIFETLGNVGRLFESRQVVAESCAKAGRIEQARWLFNANLEFLNQIGEREQARRYAGYITQFGL